MSIVSGRKSIVFMFALNDRYMHVIIYGKRMSIIHMYVYDKFTPNMFIVSSNILACISSYQIYSALSTQKC